MPFYEYSCAQCAHEFELLEGVTQEKVKRECPRCGSEKIRKLISRVTIGSKKGSSSCNSCLRGTCATCH